MRIRKRQVPLPLSSLSPIPFSDPNSPMVQLHQMNDPHQNLFLRGDASYSPPSEDRNQPIGSRTDRLDFSDADAVQKDKDCLVLLQEEEDYERGEEEEEDEGEKMKKSNDTRKNHILRAEIAAAGVLSQLSSSHQVVGRWCDGEKVFPLKKRRGSFDRGGEDEEEEEKEKKMKTKIKTKMNKKFAEKKDDEEEEEKGSNAAAENNTNTGSKKKVRGGAIMEGSRCSRVNGRGWRCCQKTLVGYSLCEHHLGKGRLRSMNSVRSRSLGSSASSKNEKSKQPLMSTLEESKSKPDREAGGEEEDEKPLMVNTKKKLKLGMVKARSISSLLEQKDSEMIITSNNL